MVIAQREARSTGRERSALALLVVFLGMALLSAAIGWSSHHTVMNVYNETMREMGTSIPNPFGGVSALDTVRNTTIYIVLIGALLAIVVGVRASVRDRKAGVTDLIFSRPVKLSSYLAGKLLGAQVWMAVVLVVAGVGSWFSVWVVLGKPLSAADTAALVGFYALAWLFLLPFCVLGMVSGARSRHESTALLAPILIWVAITFAVPQLGTAQNPTALMNPTPAVASTNDLFFHANKVVLQPVSVTEHFKHASAVLLGLRDAGSSSVTGDLLSLGLIALFSLGALALVTRSSMRRPLYE